MKLTKRKGFNFFRSYYDVYNELDDKNKLLFMEALLDRQFLGIKPEGLTGMAKFAYISQTNSIDGQVKGYNDKMKALKKPLLGCDKTPIEPPAHGGEVPPTGQEEGEVKEEGQGEGREKGILTLGLSNDNFFLVIPKQLHSTKYRVNGTDGLLEFVETHSSVLPLYTDELGRKFMRNNKGRVFNEFSHVHNTWNKFIQQ